MSIRQVRIKLKTNEEGVQYARQHKGGGHEVCRECKRGQRNHGVFERSRICWFMESPRLCKGPRKGRNYEGVSKELVEKKNGAGPYSQRLKEGQLGRSLQRIGAPIQRRLSR
jgi:hypothetical protein